MFSKNSKEQINNTSVVGESVLIEGNFDCMEDVVVYGKINGSIKTSENVFIKNSSIVNADIKAKNVFLDGVVNGNIACLESIEISKTAKLNGDLSTKVINIEKGALFNGKCTITEDKKADLNVDGVVNTDQKEEDDLLNEEDSSSKVKNKKQKTK